MCLFWAGGEPPPIDTCYSYSYTAPYTCAILLGFTLASCYADPVTRCDDHGRGEPANSLSGQVNRLFASGKSGRQARDDWI
jgi:hypothetical protein